MKKNIIMISTIILWCWGISSSNGQDVEVRALKIGDKVPDLLFPAINHGSDTFRISDAKGRLLLLEFWAPSCAVCIMQFPKLSRLQQLFGDRLTIMPLGIDSRTRDSGRFYSDNFIGDPQVQLPTAIVKYPDTVFHNYFKFTGMPHVIWIGADQRIIAITDHMAVNSANIEKALSGSPLDFRPKPIMRFLQKDETFLIPDKTVTGGSAVHAYIDSLYGSGGTPQIFVSGEKRIFRAINISVPGLYRSVLRNERKNVIGNSSDNLFGRKFVIMGKDFPYRDLHDIAETWDNYQLDRFRQENLFCYEFMAPADLPIGDFYRKIILDLDEKFGVSSSVESRVVRHSSVTLLPEFFQNMFERKADTESLSYFERLNLVHHLSALASRLNYRKDFPEPVGHSGPDVKFDVPIYLEMNGHRDREETLEYLGRQGVFLLRCDKLVEVLVLNNK